METNSQEYAAPDLFISYARADRERVQPLVDALEAHGWTVWWDLSIRAGERFPNVIADALSQSACVIVVWSEHSVRSHWVIAEAEEGANREILVPVLLDQVPIPIGFRGIHTADFVQWSGNANDILVQKLIQGISAVAGEPRTDNVVLHPASTAIRETAITQKATPKATPELSVAELTVKDPVLTPLHQRWHPLATGYPPAWATGWGEDDYGVFVDVKLSNSRFRLRWIPPGQFYIGSPETEPGRYEYESPRARISLSQGYWLMDTPVTQALWELVMGDNPSRFQSPDRPVEGVSWDDVQEFLFKVNSRVGGQSLRLPSESEWEYACRGGTEEATYAGAMTIKGENNAPVLDAIAWYGGNSGIDFELEEGVESGEWREKQYEHSKAGTHPVGKKSPNRWGCYDMLGNVWEWCEDVWSDSHEGIDIRGGPRIGSSDEKGGTRVVRGGSWGINARYVRAACRLWAEPDVRDVNLGFRCVLGQSSAVARDERLSPASELGGAAPAIGDS